MQQISEWFITMQSNNSVFPHFMVIKYLFLRVSPIKSINQTSSDTLNFYASIGLGLCTRNYRIISIIPVKKKKNAN